MKFKFSNFGFKIRIQFAYESRITELLLLENGIVPLLELCYLCFGQVDNFYRYKHYKYM